MRCEQRFLHAWNAPPLLASLQKEIDLDGAAMPSVCMQLSPAIAQWPNLQHLDNVPQACCENWSHTLMWSIQEKENHPFLPRITFASHFQLWNLKWQLTHPNCTPDEPTPSPFPLPLLNVRSALELSAPASEVKELLWILSIQVSKPKFRCKSDRRSKWKFSFSWNALPSRVTWWT